MAKVAVPIALSVAERRELESLARAHKTGQAMARRARIVLGAAAGLENKAICVEVGVDANTVSKWRRRFAAHRLDGSEDVVGGLGPAEGLGIGVVRVDEGLDVVLELLGGAVHAAPDLLFGEQGEEALDLIEPGRAGGG